MLLYPAASIQNLSGAAFWARDRIAIVPAVLANAVTRDVASFFWDPQADGGHLAPRRPEGLPAMAAKWRGAARQARKVTVQLPHV